jgi:hypothetical protein
MGIGQRGSAFNNSDPGVLKHAGVYAIKTFNLGVFISNQSGPVKPDLILRHTPAVAFGIFDVFAGMSAVNEQFFGNTANVDAGSTEVPRLNNCDFCAFCGRHSCQSDATGPGANYDQVKVMLVSHDFSYDGWV